MRKQLIIALAGFASLFTPSAYGQLQEQRHNFSIGVNGGVNLNTVSFEPRIRLSTYMTPTFGVTARYISEKYFKMICGIQTEINYSPHGWKELIEDGSGDTYHRQMNYVEVPLLAHLAFGSDERGGRFIVNLGPQVGFLLSEKEVKSATWDTSNRTNGIVEQYGYMADRKFAYGIVVGAGAEIRTGIGHFVLEGRYYYGLSDFYNNTKKDVFSRSGISAIVGKLTYLFDIRK